MKTDNSDDADTAMKNESRFPRATASPKMYTFLCSIAEGNFGKIYKAEKNVNPQKGFHFVVKLLDRDHRSMWKRECRVGLAVQHPFLTHFYACFEDKQKLYIVMDIKFSFKSFVEHVGDMNDTQTAFYLAELVLAIMKLHSLNIAHNDLKLKNLLLDQSSGHISVVDYGHTHFNPRNKKLYLADWCWLGKLLLDLLGYEWLLRNFANEWNIKLAWEVSYTIGGCFKIDILINRVKQIKSM